MQEKEPVSLLGKFLEGNMTAAEIGRFKELLHTNDQEETWLRLIGEALAEKNAGNAEPVEAGVLYRELQVRLQEALPEDPLPVKAGTAAGKPARILWLSKWVWAAASVLVVLGAGIFFLVRQKQMAPAVRTAGLPDMDIAPGREGAVLTLADGRQVVLDSLGNGVVATQGGAKLVLKNGRLTYDPTGEETSQVVYNAISTPNGRQISIVLPDGSRVWLNSASVLRYPTVFPGNERRVEITGEAYFEVAPRAEQPFRVSINGRAEVEVLGTSFNINAYANEEGIHTTLLDGRVKVAAAPLARQVTLLPGQQAQIVNTRERGGADAAPAIQVVQDADIDKVMAWKNGLFNFDNASIEEVMRQLERWYNIEVVYEKGIPNITFGGKLRRDVSLSGVLRSLEESEVHFRIEEGRRLVVTP